MQLQARRASEWTCRQCFTRLRVGLVLETKWVGPVSVFFRRATSGSCIEEPLQLASIHHAIEAADVVAGSGILDALIGV